MRYMQNPITTEVWHVDHKLGRKLSAYGWVRVKRVRDAWVKS